jgi:hypothetical protein
VRHVKTPEQETKEFYDRSTAQFTEAVLELARCRISRLPGPVAHEQALQHMSEVIVASKQLADMMGRRRVLLETDARKSRYGMSRPATYDTLVSPIVPKIDYVQAIEDLVTRDPRLAGSAAEVAEIYNTSHGFALAKSADEVVTQRVQELIEEFLKKGLPTPSVQVGIAQIGDWAHSYGETVFRTNVGTAYAEGRVQMAKDPEVADFVVGLRRYSARDVDVRPNHRASDGITAPANHVVWKDHGVPGGYNCRCGYDIVDRLQANREGILGPNGQLVPPRVPEGAYNDKGFTGKLMTESV